VTVAPSATAAAGPGEGPMGVALLTPAYWPEVRRGGERLAHDVATALAARGHGVRILTAHPSRTATAVEDGVTVVRAWRPPDGRLRRRGYEDHLTHVPLAYAALRRGRDDVAHALHHADALAATRWARATGRPAVWTFLGVPHRTGLANRRRRLDLVRRAIDGSDAVVAISEAAARGFRRWLGVDPHVIHPGVDLAAFTPGGERAAAPTILCPAALDQPFKRAGLLLDAFALVRRERPGARLVVQRGGPPGEGVEHRDLDRHEDLLAAYREAHVTALASRGEAFGLVLVESMACGTPAVAAGDAAGPEVIGDAGATFCGDDPRALARALLTALDGPDPQACRAQAARFTLDRCADAHERLYGDLLAARQLRPPAR